MALELRQDLVNESQAGDWYLQNNESLAGVTNTNRNPEVGIEDIQWFNPTQAQKNAGMVAVVTVKTLAGTIRATIHQSKNFKDTLYLRPPQNREEKEGQETKWHNEVNFTQKAKAQILRYIHGLCYAVETPATATAGIGAVGAGVGANPVGQMTPEQQQAMFAQFMAQQQAMMAQQGQVAQPGAIGVGVTQPASVVQTPPVPASAPVVPPTPISVAGQAPDLGVIPQVVNGQVATPVVPANPTPAPAGDPFANVPTKQA